MKPTEILKRLRAEFGDETLSRDQMYDWSRLFKEGRKEDENMRKLYLLWGKLWSTFFESLKVSYSSIF
jgi:hypothetical protein